MIQKKIIETTAALSLGITNKVDGVLDLVHTWLLDSNNELNAENNFHRPLNERKIHHLQKAEMVFNVLHKKYHSAFLLEQKNGVWFFRKSMFDGKNLHLHRPVPFPVPRETTKKVLKQKAKAIVNALGLNNSLDGDAEAYLIRPQFDFAYLLISELPSLLNYDLVEKSLDMIKEVK